MNNGAVSNLYTKGGGVRTLTAGSLWVCGMGVSLKIETVPETVGGVDVLVGTAISRW